jgi:hypothetical protein
MFMIWFVLCFFINASGGMRIGNGAHAGGLAFGACVGWWLSQKAPRPLLASGLVLLLVASIFPLFGVPWSGEWTAVQAMKAMEKRDYAAAEKWLRRSIDKGQDAGWGWGNLAQIYGFEERAKEYADALAHLRKADPKSADEVESRYGPPAEPKQ